MLIRGLHVCETVVRLSGARSHAGPTDVSTWTQIPMQFCCHGRCRQGRELTAILMAVFSGVSRGGRPARAVSASVTEICPGRSYTATYRRVGIKEELLCRMWLILCEVERGQSLHRA